MSGTALLWRGHRSRESNRFRRGSNQKTAEHCGGRRNSENTQRLDSWERGEVLPKQDDDI